MSDTPGKDGLEALRAKLRVFVAERDWAQFHNPKNLAMALVAEAGELVEQFQWLTPEQAERLTPQALTEVEHELADVFIFLIELADRLNVDLLAAAERKLRLNEQKYPVEKARGRAILPTSSSTLFWRAC